MDKKIDTVIYSQITEDYLSLFADKDIDGIKDLLADNCTLMDWSCSCSDKTAVISNMTSLFSTSKTIEVTIINLLEDGKHIVAEILLTIDNVKLSVVDILQFNDNQEIELISAYMR
jgi:hypothetical protein